MRAPVQILSVVTVVNPVFGQQQPIADLSEAHGPFTLTAMCDSATGHNVFAYRGRHRWRFSFSEFTARKRL